ncbi:MAG: dihydrodipicolinate reductase C-terminal domain-containing protein [Elusimicrobia bacterium]|nr:dihydrodipicolinate reductase C-terminal domain-containing protein [Elusimicrobiota bacterium]MDY6039554.1 dihydrodipicolinate reductase C-terminal domain-containing protein [Elusimicrobiaceae bacterium]
MNKALINGADGKMGRALIRLIKERPELGLQAVAHESGTPFPEDFDVIIDFSSPQGAQEAFAAAKHKHKPFLTGTTNLPETFLFQLQQEEKIPAFFAPNVSLSVYFFTELVRQAAKMYAGYDIKLHEIHHIHKKDAPSGTAKKLADAVNLPYDKVTYERIGETVGTHIAAFDSPFDEITLAHKAVNRDLFAASALEITVWLMKRAGGFYTMSDYAKFKLKEKKK